MKKNITAVLILLLIGIVILYKYKNQSESQSEILLFPETTINLSLPEPSGLYYDNKSNTLWTVSDENSTIYNIDLKGKILESIVVDGFDLEGITMIDDSILVTILERERTVVFINKAGKELKRFKIDISGEPNKGLEGISYNPFNSHLYIINEKEPGILFEIDTSGNIISLDTLRFASDYSGLSNMKANNGLWIISDEEEAIYKYSLNDKIIKKFKVDIEQIEGIAFNDEKSLLYIVSDPLEKLFIYSLP